ncbi:MAG: leucine-rich repeat domain-containing protein [Methanocorpusculum sp.]|nr:leucine-rich repeat domain-containing protein [Methanocorpusculum sp.]
MENTNILKIKSAQKDTEEICISKEVEGIASYAFKNLKSLKKVTFENGSNLKEIGNEAFMDCWSLESISLPQSLKHIGDYAFASCDGLCEVEIPEGVISIGKGAFLGCGSLKEIRFPNSLKKISKSAFAQCFDLKYAEFAGDIKIIEDKCFSKCENLIEVDFHGSVKKIGKKAFSGCRNLEIVFSLSDTKKIGKKAFANCQSLSSLYLPETLEEIGVSAFSGSGIKSIDLPDSVKNIGYAAFYNCKLLKRVSLPCDLYCIPAECFYGCLNLESVRFSAGLNCICYSAFCSCISLKTVRLPSGLKEIHRNVFEGCCRLKSVFMPEDLDILDDWAFINIHPNYYNIDGLKIHLRNQCDEYPEERPEKIVIGRYSLKHELKLIDMIYLELRQLRESHNYLCRVFDYGTKTVMMYPNELSLIKSSMEMFVDSAEAVMNPELFLSDAAIFSVKNDLNSLELILPEFYKKYDEDSSAKIWESVSDVFSIIDRVYNVLSDIDSDMYERYRGLEFVVRGRMRFMGRRFCGRRVGGF